MSDNSSNNKRIAKNTFVLYLRMILILVVGIYTCRVVLNTLGVEDYGLYNVVGGFVTIFTFLNGAMSTATQRFITFELAKGDLLRQRITFSTAINIHLALAIVITLLAETIGLWFVYNKLVIPAERFTAALWVYQLSIAALFIQIVSIPYNAAIIAHEKMSAFAFISIMDVGLKLAIVYVLTLVSWDKLIFYAVLLFLVGVLDRIIYGAYCGKNFPEAKYSFVIDKSLLRKMTNIAGWSMFGNLAGVGYTQGLNILLNMFFGPAVNAARGVAVTVQGVVSGFVANFQMALNPQITKSYAVNDLKRMHTLIYASSKFSFYLLFLVVWPIMIEAQEILTVWLKLVPDHTVWFMRLILSIMLIEALANPMMISSQAVGKVKVYQSVVGGLLLLILPFSYIVLKLGANPESVFIVHLLLAIVAQFFRVFIVGRMIFMPFFEYTRVVLMRIAMVFILVTIPTYTFYKFLPNSHIFALVVLLLTFLTECVVIIAVGLTKCERNMMFQKVNSIIKKKLL